MSTFEPSADPLATSVFQPNEDELKNSLARIVKRGLKPVALGLVFTYTIFTIGHMLLLPPEIGIILVPLAAFSALFFLGMYWLARTDKIPTNRAQAVAGSYALVTLLNSVVHLAITGDPLQSTNLMIVILAVGAFFLSAFWFILIVVLAFVSWLLVLILQPLPLDFSWVHFAFGMVVSVITSTLIQRVRLTAYRNMTTLQLQNQAQKYSLLESQMSLEERVRERTAELAELNHELNDEIDRRQEVEEQLKENERNLMEDRSNLEKEVAKRTSELRQANLELKNAAQMKDEFMANMSHELRTPLNAILGNAEIIQERLYGPINERQAGAIKRIDDSGRHLLNLISDILDVSKIEAGKLELNLSPVNIGSLCRNTIAMMRTEAALKKIELSLILDPSVKIVVADSRRIKQVIVNLLGNAIKFTPEGGRVGLIVRGRPEDALMNIMVWDTGIGISEKNSANLFQPFVQLESPLAKEQEGTGLGLALSRKFAELHGGTIGLKSQPGNGSLFIVTLPWTMETRFTDSAEPIVETVTEGSEQENNLLQTMPIDAEPTQIVEWISRSPDLESFPQETETAD